LNIVKADEYEAIERKVSKNEIERYIQIRRVIGKQLDEEFTENAFWRKEYLNKCKKISNRISSDALEAKKSVMKFYQQLPRKEKHRKMNNC
jgi:predicted DNA binding CopG/RHH family protein